MQSTLVRLVLLGLSALAINIGVAFPLVTTATSSALDNPACVCNLSVEPVTYPNPPPAGCEGTFTISVSSYNMSDGHCNGGECGLLELKCHVDVTVVITGTDPCRFKIWQDSTRIGGGWLGTGGVLDADAELDIACDDFAEVSVTLGANETMLEVHPYICDACSH